MKVYPLGRIPSPFDKRDYNLTSFIPDKLLKKSMMPLKLSQSWNFPAEPLDQGEFPHCVGFSGANFGINSPVNTMYTNEDGHKFYYLCKEIDGEPLKENGSCIRSIAKVLKNVGRIDVYAFAYSMDMIKWWIINKGPMIAGTIWTLGMFEPDSANIIHPTGEILGGHAYLLNEWTENNYIGIQNSWGNYWGINGKAYISATDFEKLFAYDGEVMTTVELPLIIETNNSIFMKFLKSLIDLFCCK